MEEILYSVSEAVRLVGVESHVLRYWEEELKIPIQRTSQGHRVYSRNDIETFCRVRQWKQKGLQLKAIRILLEEPDTEENARTFESQVRRIVHDTSGQEEETFRPENEREDESRPENEREEEREDGPSYEIVRIREAASDSEKGVQLLKQMIEEVVAEQNRRLEREIARQLREELESLYFQYVQALREASAAREGQGKAGMFRQLIKKLFPDRS